jgi:hypothetical protein
MSYINEFVNTTAAMHLARLELADPSRESPVSTSLSAEDTSSNTHHTMMPLWVLGGCPDDELRKTFNVPGGTQSMQLPQMRICLIVTPLSDSLL